MKFEERRKEIEGYLQEWRKKCWDTLGKIGDLNKKADSPTYSILKGDYQIIPRDTILTGHAENQLLNRIEVPARYVHKCPPALQATNINYWIEKYSKKSAFLRYIREGEIEEVRAIFSKKYIPLDDWQVVPQVLDIVATQVAQGEEIDLSHFGKDQGFTILEMVYRASQVQLDQVGIFFPGIALVNSEIGCCALWIKPFIRQQSGNFRFLDSSKEGSTRFVHIKEVTSRRIEEGLREARRASEVGISHLLETGSIYPEDTIKECRDTILASEILPHRILKVLEDEFQAKVRVSKLEIARAILNAVKELPPFQKYLAESEVGRYLNLFQGTSSRIAKIVQEGIQ